MPTYSKRGLELSVNTAGAWTQTASRVATFADGGFVVVWDTSDTTADGSGGAIKAQRFDSAGNKTGGEFLVNSSFATTQSLPVVTSFADGSFAVAWMTDDPAQDGAGRAIKARLFSASGTAVGPEFLVNTATAGNQGEPSITTLANGNFVISWWEAWFGEVHARIFTADGTPLGPDFRVNTNTDSLQNSSDIIGLADGGFVVTWRTTNTAQDGSGEAVKGQVFSSTGAKVGSEFLVNTSKFGNQNDPSVAALTAGGFVVTWVDSGSTIKMQLFSATGAKVGGEKLVSSTSTSPQEQPAVTALPDGGFMVVWTTTDSAQDGDRYAVKAQVFDSAGVRVGSELLVNTQAIGNQWYADIATLSDGRVIVTWTDNDAEGNGNWGIKAQILGPGDPPPPPPPPNLAPRITSDGGMDTAQRWVDENGTIAADVAAWDPDGHAITYSIIGGADAALFTIDAQTGIVSFISKPNFEAPGDSNGNNSYDIIVQASDGLLADTQALRIDIADVDENVAFTSSNNIFRSEAFTGAYVVKAVQPADPSATITYRIVGGSDAALFTINSATGALRFISQPDYEAPADVGGDNDYSVGIEATDGVTTATDWLVFHILDSNESPVIASGGGGTSLGLSLPENQSAVTTVSASDPENRPLTYAIAGGEDAARFSINAATGALSFVTAPDFEAPHDADGNNLYVVTVSASDGSLSDTQTIYLTVTNRNETPAITSNGGGSTAAIAFVENGLEVTIVSATDPEKTAIAYSIAGGADASRFAINSTTGALRFLASPDFEQPADSDGNNAYEVVVRASDGVNSSTQALSIAVGNANERPMIVSNGGGTSAFVELDEGQAVVTTVAADDPEGAGSVTYSITGGAHADLFTIDSATGALSFAAAPDYEAPLGESSNFYSVTVTASDGELSSFQSVQVGVRNVNEGVTITSGAAASVEENDRAVMTVTAEDLDGNTVSFAISGGADAALFAVDAETGELSFLAAPNFEAPADSNGDNIYEVEVSASDGNLSDSKSVSVTVTNKSEAIVFVSGGGGDQAAVTIDENEGNVLGLVAVDPDGAAPHYGIAGGADAALFELDPVTKGLRFKSLPDFEAPGDADGDNVYEVVVGATDGQSFDYQTVSVTVGNVYEGVSFAVPAEGFLVDEGSSEIAAVSAQGEADAEIVYYISGGADAALFDVDWLTGALSWLVEPDFEAPGDADGDNVYDLIVSASDGRSSASQGVSVTVADVDDPVEMISYGGAGTVSLSLEELRFQVGLVEAADPEGAAVAYAIVGGADAGLFAIDPDTGAFKFAGFLPNFEAPADSDGDNVYEVTVEATAGGSSATQAFAVTVFDVNEGIFITSNGGDNSVGLTFDEGTSHVTTVAAHDPDGAAPVYSITGGNDRSLFTIDPATGVLRFVEAPDYETRRDVHEDNIYEVIVTASDGELSDWQFISVLITNVNEAVTITSGGGADSVAVTVGEDRSAVADVDAVDTDGTTVFYSIAGGADAAFFGIDLLTGELSIVGADYDLPGDADGDNVYEVIVAADDGVLSDTQAFSVTLADVDEPLSFTSYNSDFYVTLELGENGLDAAAVAAEDPEGRAIVYSIVDSYDGASFTIDAQTGLLQFLSAPDYDAPGDLDGNNVYTVLVAATDGTFFDYQNISIHVQDLEERPVITTGPALSVGEDSVYVKVEATDSDGDPLTYSIVGGADSSHFWINPETGDLTTLTALDYEAPVDSDGDNVYEVTVRASDGGLFDDRQLSITVNDVYDDVEIVSYDGADLVTLTLPEGFGYQIIDVDASISSFSGTRFAITGGADAALFEIDPWSGLVSFAYPFRTDFEAPGDADGDNVYDLVVTATQATSSDSQAFAITVADRNEHLSITSHGWGETVVLNEGNQAVTTIVAVDQDGDAPVYSIAGGADAALFAIDSATGALTFIAAPDFEAPGSAAGTNLYLVEVAASDGEFTHQLPIRVQIGNVNERPVITSGGGGESLAVTVNENGLAVTGMTAGDADGNPLTWSITGGADASLFTIESWSGALRFVGGPNFEAPGDVGGNNVYDVVVSVTDGLLTDSQAVAVTVANVNEALAITSNGGGSAASVAVAENGTAVTLVSASDPDGGAVTYAIAGGADAARFTINSTTGALSFVSAPNFEAPADAGGNNVYDVVVSATDGSWTDSQALAVSVGNVNEGVVITSNGGGSSASVAVSENGTVVATVSASDADGGAVTYAIAGGADSSRFTINAATGALAFIAAPNFEAPGDSGGNNVYDVLVSASDGTFSDTQAIAVQVGNVNEAPAVTSNGGGAAAAVSVAENSLAVTTVSAGDPDGTAATYSIVGGADAARFTINPQTGLLQFVAAPDYELPADSDGNNVYAVVVRASDGQLSDDQALSVTVGNVRDGNNVTGTSSGDSISATSTNVALRTSNEEDTVFGRDGHDNIQGMAGDDDLYGEGGNDVLIGGTGADRLTGGLGKDQYTFNSVSESSVMARDVIMDFSRIQGDKISLSAIDSNTGLSNNQAFTFIGTAAFSNVAGQLRYETWGGVTTISGDVDGDAVADLVIQLSGSITLISSDFIL